MERADTRDVAALLAATDDQGHFDPVTYEAQRLILHNQHAGRLDAETLMRRVHESPLYQTGDRDKLVKTISDSLDNSADQARFDSAMGMNYRLSQARRGAEIAWSWTEEQAIKADKSVSDTLAAEQLRDRRILNNPNSNWAERAAAKAESEIIGSIQDSYGMTKGAASDAVGMVVGAADAAKMAYRFSADPKFRDELLHVVVNYAEATSKDLSKPAKDAYHAARSAYDTWEAGYKKAEAEGRGAEYLGHAKGVVGFEVVTALVPVSKAGKVGEALKLLDHAPIRSTEEAVHVLEGAAKLEREGAEAAKLGEAVTRSALQSAREEGKLAEFLQAAKRTDTVNGMLRAGVFTTDDLKEIAKIDSSVFKKVGAVSKDGVTFQEALDATTKGIDLKKLNAKQIGDIGEALHTYEMASKGYTDIVSIKNKSGHGIDFVGRNPTTKELEFHEVKTSIVGRAAEQKGNPKDFIESRLQRAIDAQKHWSEKNTLPGLSDTARKLQKEISAADGKINAKWVKIDVSRTPGSPKLHVEKSVQEWTRPLEHKHAQVERPANGVAVADAKPLAVPKDMRDPNHPGHSAFRVALNEVNTMEGRCGIPSGPHSERLAAGLTVATEYARTGIDRVELRGDQAVAISRPQGVNDPGKPVAISTEFATSRSVEEHSAEWLKARSPYYGQAPAAERTPEQARLLNELSPKDQAMFAKLRENAPPQISDDAVAHAALQARRAGIDSPDKLGAVAIRGDQLYLQSAQTGHNQAVNLAQPVPPMHETVQHAQVFNQQQTQQQAAAQQQLTQDGPRGPAIG